MTGVLLEGWSVPRSALARRPATRSFPIGPRGLTRWAGRLRASKGEGPQESKESHKDEVKHLREELEKGGLTKDVAEQVLKSWREEMGHDVTPDDLRKVLMKSSQRFTGYLLLQMLLDAGAAYGAYVGGTMLGGAVEQYGVPALVLQGVAFILAGYYAAGVFFDVFKAIALLAAFWQFNVNSATFLEAVQELAGSSRTTGLNTLDKAREAVNMVRVLQALLRVSDLLQQRQAAGAASSKPDMLRDLGAYLTLEKAQRSFGFDAASMGLTDKEAANIAVAFSTFDSDDDGVLSLDEFRRLCAQYAPDLNDAEVQAGFRLLDANSDGQVEFKEFVNWWLKKLALPAAQ